MITGSAAEAMEDYERAIAAYESSLRHNPYSVPAMNAIAGVHRTMDRFEKVSDYDTLFLPLADLIFIVIAGCRLLSACSQYRT